MVFSSTIFLLAFLPFVICIYYNPWVKSIRFKNYFLLIVSLVFYAWGEPVFVFLMIISIIVTWIIGNVLKRCIRHKKAVLTIGIIYHVVIMISFKYLSFIVQQVGLLIMRQDIELGIKLPIGISFFTFQMMSYLFDVYYKKADVQTNVLKLALYVSLFPQLIAGPIVRYNQIEEEINNRSISRQDFTEGMERFIYGLAKKVMLSNYLAYIADTFFDADNRSMMGALLGAVCYSLQIYFDFSGYSDMAIGLGRIFGFHFAENFNYPYISSSITEFWRRWHISLSTWFRDYVYIPLGGNRVSKLRWVLNIFIVWALTGIWHGANWTFLIWGLLYFVVLLIEKQFSFTQKIGWLSHIYTLIIVIIAWVIFRSDNVTDALIYLGNMIGINSSGLIDGVFIKMISSGAIVIIAAIVLSTPIYRYVLTKIGNVNALAKDIVRAVACVVLFALSLVEVVASTYSPFIYFNF